MIGKLFAYAKTGGQRMFLIIVGFARKNWIALAFMLATWLSFFGRLLSGVYVYFLDDLKLIYYPLEHVYAQAMAQWQLPQWSNLFGFGHPLLSWGQLGFFTPIHLMLRAMGVSSFNVLQISMPAYYGLGLLGMFLFLRLKPINLGQEAAALGSVIFVFSGFHVGHLNHVNFYTTTMWLPWLWLLLALFVAKQTVRRSVGIGLLGGMMAVSGQPQIILYSFLMAVILAVAYTIARRHSVNYLKLTAGFLLAGVLAFGLGAVNILPLREFLPLTDRAAGLSRAELLEFSYPPLHAVTLMFPYIFGDHELYWGAKGFQELSAYVGILPIILTCLALFRWQKHRWLRTGGAIMLAVGIILALGKYSPAYRYLITFNELSFLSVPGRFVFFFDTGVAILSALALNDLANLLDKKWKYYSLAWTSAALLPFLFLLPFILQLARAGSLPSKAWSELTSDTPALLMFVVGVITYGLVRSFGRHNLMATKIFLLAIISISLIVLGWRVNPMGKRQSVISEAVFSDTLALEISDGMVPPRFYAREQLLVDSVQNRSVNTKEIAPSLSIFQPLAVVSQQSPCFRVSGRVSKESTGQVEVGLHTAISSNPLQVINLAKDELSRTGEALLCFDNVEIESDKQYLLSFRSLVASGVTLKLERLSENEKSVYLVRTENISTEVIMSSQKSFRLVIREAALGDNSTENLLRPRHLQVVDGFSGARWVGALAINGYRQFIDYYLANDAFPFDGEYQHVLDANRKIFDLAGITHLMQVLEPGDVDLMEPAGFPLIDEKIRGDRTFRLYQNPRAYAKVFWVPEALYDDVNENVLIKMANEDWQPNKLVYISGPSPPDEDDLRGGPGSVQLMKYEDQLIEIQVQSEEGGWLVINDSTTPNWRAYVDGQITPYYVADTVFKAAHIPAGDHDVEFIYYSSATERAKATGKISLAAVIFLLIIPSNIFARFRKRFLLR